MKVSPQQRHALELLSFAVPLHQTNLIWSGVRGPTLVSLERRGLARLTFLYEDGGRFGMPFWTLTQAGEKIVGRRLWL